MAEQPLPDETQSSPTPPGSPWALKMLFWAIIGAGVGALWALFHYGTEGWSGPVVVMAVSFGLVGAILSLFVGQGCKT